MRADKNKTQASFGSRQQIRLALGLISVIPVLTVSLITISAFYSRNIYSTTVLILISICASMLSSAGFLIIRKYPQNIERLRNDLMQIAGGELPKRIHLIESEDDIAAIEDYMNKILNTMHQRIRILQNQLKLSQRMRDTINLQMKEIVAAEQHRVMIQSVGAACHHLGQPATVLRAYLQILQKEEKDPEQHKKLSECITAVETMAEILEKLQHVSKYRTVPYQTFDFSEENFEDQVILDIEGKS